jgi:hypothetical protein
VGVGERFLAQQPDESQRQQAEQKAMPSPLASRKPASSEVSTAASSSQRTEISPSVQAKIASRMSASAEMTPFQPNHLSTDSR